MGIFSRLSVGKSQLETAVAYPVDESRTDAAVVAVVEHPRYSGERRSIAAVVA
jgi:hypothetical protein